MTHFRRRCWDDARDRSRKPKGDSCRICVPACVHQPSPSQLVSQYHTVPSSSHEVTSHNVQWRSRSRSRERRKESKAKQARAL